MRAGSFLCGSIFLTVRGLLLGFHLFHHLFHLGMRTIEKRGFIVRFRVRLDLSNRK